MGPERDETWDVIVIGSGFGGVMAAVPLVQAGRRVLMLERGGWVERGPENWSATGVGELTPHYCRDAPYRVREGPGEREIGGYFCVGGPSVFYGGVSLRMREQDFAGGRSGQPWPFRYPDLEPWYHAAEELLDVAGTAGLDPTDPPRSSPYPVAPAELAPTSEKIQHAARSLGLSPFPLPLAINYRSSPERSACQSCPTCDGFACAVGAKNDLATTIIPALLRWGMQLRPDTVVTRIEHDGSRVSGIHAVDRRSREPLRFEARQVILAAGALGSPHLLLASGLDRVNPGGHVVGRFLMRHYNEIVFGFFPRAPGRTGRFHKQLGIHDFYHELGGLQQMATPPTSLVRAYLPRLLRRVVTPAVPHLTGLLIMAEDEPQRENGVRLDSTSLDCYGMPRLVIEHRYSARDRAAGAGLIREAKRILRKAGCLATYRHHINTFSHAVGTVRMGDDPARSALDSTGHFRGLENLSVLDGSFMPSSAAVNPSLTIAANALRAGHALAGTREPLEAAAAATTREGGRRG